MIAAGNVRRCVVFNRDEWRRVQKAAKLARRSASGWVAAVAWVAVRDARLKSKLDITYSIHCEYFGFQRIGGGHPGAFLFAA